MLWACTLFAALGIVVRTTEAQGAGSQLPNWHVAPVPALRLGSDASVETTFTRATAVRTASGQIAVVDGGSREVRVFSSAGQFIRTLSRKGQGPGEFESSSVTVASSGDSVFVIERPPAASQVHVYVVPTGFQARVPLRGGAEAVGGVSVLARLSTGQFLVVSGGFRIMPTMSAGVLLQDTVQLGLLTAGTPGRFVSLGRFPSRQVLGYELPSIVGQVGVTTFPYGSQLVAGASGAQVWLGNSGSGEIIVIDSSGQRITRLDAPLRPRPFVRARLDRARQRALAAASSVDERARISAMHNRALLPRTAPVYVRFLAGPNGEFWLEEVDEDPAAPARFLVMDRSGRAVARVSLPAPLRVDQIGVDHLIGVSTNEDGVETIMLYRFTRS